MKKMFLLLLLSVSCLLAGCQAPKSGVVEKKISKNLKQPYYVFRPDNYDSKMPVAVVVPGGGEDETRVLETLKKYAVRDNFVLVVQGFNPGFSGFRNKEDLQFIGMVQDLKDSLNINYSNLYLLGFAEGATFVQRVAMMYPALVKSAVLINGPAFYPFTKNANSVKILLLADSATFKENQKFLQALEAQGFKAQLQSFTANEPELTEQAGKTAFAFFLQNLKTSKENK